MADNIINIGAFEFDSKRITESLTDLEKSLFNLRKEQQRNRDENRELNKSYKDLESTQQNLLKTQGVESESYKKVTAEMGENLKRQQQLYKAGLDITRELKNTNKEYQETIKVQDQATKSAEKLNDAIDQEINSINKARAENKEYTRERNATNTATAEGRARVAELNAMIDANSQFIKENVSNLERQRLNVGNYKKDIMGALTALEEQKKALQEQETALTQIRDETEKGSKEWNYYNTQLNQINIQINSLNNEMGQTTKEIDLLNIGTNALNGNFLELAKEAESVGGAQNLLIGGFKTATTAIYGMIKASLAFIATPIGAVLAVIAGAVLLVTNAMKRNEDSANKMSVIFAKLGSILTTVLKALEPLGNFLVDVVVGAFENATKVANVFMFAMEKMANFIGLEKLANSINAVSTSFRENAKLAQDLANAEINLTKAQRGLKISTSENIEEMERLKNIRDDESKSIEDRTKANERLGAILKDQNKIEKEIAEQQLKIVQQQIKLNGRKTELIDAEIDAKVKLNEIDARIMNQQREVITKNVELKNKATELSIKQANERIAKQREEIDYFITSQGIEAKTLEESISIKEQLYNKEIEILDAQLKNKLISQTKYNTDVLKLQQDLAKEQSNLAISLVDKELADLKRVYEEKKINNELFTAESFNLETERLNNLLTLELEREQERKELGLISETDYQESILSIKNAYRDKEAGQVRLFNEQQREQQILTRQLEFEEDLLKLQGENATIYEQQLLQSEFERSEEEIRLNEMLANNLITEENYLLAKKNLDKKYSKIASEIKEEEFNATMALAGQAFGALSALAGKNSALGKSLAIADATISTYLGITRAVSLGPPMMIPAIAMATATGFGAVANIVKTKIPKGERGGIFKVGGNRHILGGTLYTGTDGNQIELEKGELMGVLNRKASNGFLNFNNAFLNGSPSVNNSVNDTVNNSNITLEDMANVVGMAVLNGARIGSMEGTNTGVVEANQNNQIRQQATF